MGILSISIILYFHLGTRKVDLASDSEDEDESSEEEERSKSKVIIFNNRTLMLIHLNYYDNSVTNVTQRKYN